MGQSFRVLVAVLGVAGLSGCAQKAIAPVQMVQPGDDQLTCAQIDKEILANEAAAKKFVERDKGTENGNTAKMILSATPYIGILSAMTIDLSNEDQIKARAILDRNESLAFLKKGKGCNQ